MTARTSSSAARTSVAAGPPRSWTHFYQSPSSSKICAGFLKSMRHKQQQAAVWVVRGLLRSRVQLPVCRGLPDQQMIVTRTSNRQVPGHAYEYHGHVYGAGSGRNSEGVLDTLAGFSQGVCCCCWLGSLFIRFRFRFLRVFSSLWPPDA